MVARIAGIMAAKKTSDLIPMCHPIVLRRVDVEIREVEGGLELTSTVATTGPTGVEMEALTAVSVAALTIYDMTKALDKLSGRQRAVFTLRHYEDRSLEEIGAALGLDVGTVKAHLSRAVKKLRLELQDLYALGPREAGRSGMA